VTEKSFRQVTVENIRFSGLGMLVVIWSLWVTLAVMEAREGNFHD
jgi:hypothetical protein